MKIKHKLELSFKEYLRSYTKNMKKTLQQFWPNNKIVVLKKLLNSSSGHAVCVCVCVCVTGGGRRRVNHYTSEPFEVFR